MIRMVKYYILWIYNEIKKMEYIIPDSYGEKFSENCL